MDSGRKQDMASGFFNSGDRQQNPQHRYQDKLTNPTSPGFLSEELIEKEETHESENRRIHFRVVRCIHLGDTRTNRICS
jgi:hypothetical protein